MSQTYPFAPSKLSNTVSATPESEISANASQPLWLRIAAKLDDCEIEYSTSQIAAALRMTLPALRHHCRLLWPRKNSRHYFFSFGEALLLIHRVCRDAHHRKVLDQENREFFAVDSSFTERARRALFSESQRRKNLVQN